MRKYLIFIGIIALISSCNQKKAAALSAQEFAQLIMTTKGLQLIDVRTPEEFQTGYIKTSLLIDMYSADFNDRLEFLDKNAPIAVYCAVGQRSYQVYLDLQEKGFKEVYHLEGGLQAWRNEGIALEY